MWLKVVAVVLLVNNGLVVAALDRQLRALPPRATFTALPRRHRYRLVGTLAVSQVCWWVATVIGLVVTTDRR